MRVIRSLGIFGASLFVGLCVWNVLEAKGWILLHGTVGRFATFMLPSIGIPLGRDFSIPLLIALVTAGTAMAFGMWKAAKSGPQLVGLILGLVAVCVFVPLLSMMTVILGFCAFGGCP
jgi:hypothetical protein